MTHEEKIFNALFYTIESPDGVKKRSFVHAGASALGRLCTVNIGSRPIPYRFSLDDINHLSENYFSIMRDGKAETLETLELRQYYSQWQIDNPLDMFLTFAELFKLMPRDLLPVDVPFDAYRKLVTGISFEVFIGMLKGYPYFTYEIFPEIEGIKMEECYGSYVSSYFPLKFLMGDKVVKNRKRAFHMFNNLVLSERTYSLPKRGAVVDPVTCKTWYPLNDLQVQDEFLSGKSLWELKEEKSILGFLSRFASEFAVQNKLVPELFHVDRYDSLGISDETDYCN